ncbi:MAG TPA: tRNA preQ1(34) S-adenosylmethionine ribosyltransferase-isomerase QueA [Acidisarcina sp.]
MSQFNFNLPPELIAQQALSDRAGSRMLSLDRETGGLCDGYFRQFPDMLRSGDLLVLNDSRVIPARLFARKAARESASGEPTSGQIEVLLTEQLSEWEWRALVRPGRKVLLRERLRFSASAGEDGQAILEADVIAHGEFGERTLKFSPVGDFFSRLEHLGHIPLPPYIHREDEGPDRERYQTVYARERGSVAAPTAGLHFTADVLERIRVRGVRIAYVTLHVGLGTFQPVRVERIEDIRLHAERYTLPAETADEINSARRDGRRVIAAGTTTMRTLEHCALQSHLAGQAGIYPHSGSTSIFISPGFDFRLVTGLLTNFHLPQSSLLMLVSAFGGYCRVMAAYRHAVAAGYRFFSYGDCMFIS